MRRYIIISSIVIVAILLAWRFWPNQSSPSTLQNKNTPVVTNFSSLSSSAFAANGSIPEKFTCKGDNISPPLTLASLPPSAKYFAIVVEDPDAPSGTYDHWVVWDIPVANKDLPENSSLGVVGKNSSGKTGYFGPCPPNGEHRYHFQAWAYPQPLELKAGSSKKQLLKALSGRALVTAELTGRFGGK